METELMTLRRRHQESRQRSRAIRQEMKDQRAKSRQVISIFLKKSVKLLISQYCLFGK